MSSHTLDRSRRSRGRTAAPSPRSGPGARSMWPRPDSASRTGQAILPISRGGKNSRRLARDLGERFPPPLRSGRPRYPAARFRPRVMARSARMLARLERNRAGNVLAGLPARVSGIGPSPSPAPARQFGRLDLGHRPQQFHRGRGDVASARTERARSRAKCAPADRSAPGEGRQSRARLEQGQSRLGQFAPVLNGSRGRPDSERRSRRTAWASSSHASRLRARVRSDTTQRRRWPASISVSRSASGVIGGGAPVMPSARQATFVQTPGRRQVRAPAMTPARQGRAGICRREQPNRAVSSQLRLRRHG